jgi:hypothetical protein
MPPALKRSDGPGPSATCRDQDDRHGWPPPAHAGEASRGSIEDFQRPGLTKRIVIPLSEIRKGKAIPAF